MYKRRRYICVCVLLLSIIALAVGLGGFGTIKDTQGKSDKEADVIIPPELVVDEKPVTDDENQTITFSDGFQAVNYGLNVLANGKGFNSYFSQVLSSLGYSQHVITKKYRSGNQNLLEEWYKTDFAFGQNTYKCFYTDQTDMKIKTISNKSNYDFDKLTTKKCAPDKLENFPYTDWTQKRKRNPLNNFYIEVNPKTCRVLYFDKSDKNNYVVKISAYPDKMDEKYYATFKESGATNVKLNSLTFCFYINKSTGLFSKITKEECVNTTFAGFANVECKIKSTEIFLSVDADVSSLLEQRYQHNFA